jgi:polar amino acid transport system permease protein
VDQFILSGTDYQRLFEGAQTTVLILLFAFILGVILSVVVGVLRLNDRAWVRGASLVFVEFFRGISSIILLFIVAIAIPIFLGLEQGNLIALASIALGANMGGYGAEIIRGAILSVPKGQTEASIALNLSEYQRLRYIILPQAMRVILPPMGNLTIEILKGTALASTVGVVELTRALTATNNAQLNGPPEDRVPYLFIALNALLIYFALSLIVTFLFRLGERYVERRYEGGSATARSTEESAEVAA